MSKTTGLLLVLIFLAACYGSVAKPTEASTEQPENTWTTKASLPDGVSLVKAAVVNGKIYAMTGVSVYEYAPDTDTWTAKNPMPTQRERSSFGIATCQNKIYVIGGSNGTRGYSNYLSTNEAYDPVTDTWESKEPVPTSMIWVEANVVNGKIYAMGVTMDEYHPGYISVNEVYDPATDSWTTKQPAPIAVVKGASAVVDNNIYILGGLSDNDTLNAISNQIYNVENGSWSFGASIPSSMWYTAAGATAGVMAPKRVYVMGGGFTEITNVVNVYDPKLDTWSSGAPLPTNRTGHAIAVIDDLFYVLGGGCGWHGGEPGTPDSGWTLTNVVEQFIPFGYGTLSPVITEQEPFPTTPVAAASIASVVMVGAGLLIYLRKRKH